MNIRDIMNDIKSDRKKKVVLDTDAFNEIDDQFAIAACYFSKKEELLAIYAEHFMHDRCNDAALGMEKSYEEIVKVMSLCDPGHNVPILRGSTTKIDVTGKAVESEAARHLVELAMNSDEIIYVLAIGAITNITSAIMMEPAIKDKICVIWLAFCDFTCTTPLDYNLEQDYKAGQILLDSEVPLIICPANWVSFLLKADIDFVRQLQGHNDVCDYLYSLAENAWEQCGRWTEWRRTLWDLGAPAIIDKPECMEYDIIPCPILTDDMQYAFDDSRHEIAWLTNFDRDPIMDYLWDVLKKGNN
ncbi:MAG: hypothetical protein E7660_03145 [Ruminococcaceae bacterium]|nr:hypothetical protein [Oscillospiraceae bacterium]